MSRRRTIAIFVLFFVSWTTAYGEGPPARIDAFGDPLPEGAIYRLGTTRLRVLPNHHFEHLSFDTKGKHILAYDTTDGKIRMWEIAGGREVRSFHAEYRSAFTISPDGTALAVADSDKIRVYELATGKERLAIQYDRQRDHANAIAYSPDGKNILALCREKKNYRVTRWEAATGKKLGAWHLSEDQPIAFSPDTRLVASVAEKENAIRLWDTASGKKVREWKTAAKVEGGSRCLCFSPDGLLAAADDDARIRVYETSSGKEIRSWKGWRDDGTSDKSDRPAVDDLDLAFAPDGKTLASVDRNKICRLWDARTGRELRHFGNVSGTVIFSADGKIVAAGGADFRLRLWETATGRDLCPFADPGRITSVVFAPNARVLIENSDRGRARLLNAQNGRPCKPIAELPGEMRAISPDGSRLLLLRRGGPLCILDAATGKERVRFADTNKGDFVAGWSPDGRTLITNGGKWNDERARVWDSATGKSGKKEWSANTICSPDGRTIAEWEETTTIRLFAVDTAKEQSPLRGCAECLIYRLVRQHENGSTGRGGRYDFRPLFSPDGKLLLTGLQGGGSFALWDTVGAKPIFRLRCADYYLENAVFSPNGRLLALLDSRGDPCLLDTATGRPLHRLTRKEGDLFWVMHTVNRAFSPDGRLFAAAYDAHTLVLWETATGQPIRVWPGHGRGHLVQMDFSSDSRQLATVGEDGTALVWDATGISPDGRLPARQLTADETEATWRALADKDAAKAHRALWTLIADPERALPMLRQRLHATAKPDPRRLAQLLADLDNDSFALREAASAELRKMGEATRSALRQTLQSKPSLEVRRRVEGLLHAIDGAPLSGDAVRELRAVAVLEHIGNDEAQRLLGTLAAGVADTLLTREAEEARARLLERARRGRSDG